MTKRCPFCGEKGSTPFLDNNKGWVVDCVNVSCPVNPKTPPCGSPEIAIEHWNKRYDE